MPVLNRSFAYTKKKDRCAPNCRHSSALAESAKADAILEKTGLPKMDGKRTRGFKDIEVNSSRSQSLGDRCFATTSSC
ncbi:MAG: hypothetical protein RLZZ407_1978 [Pseudomonadota bacterium]|jgi:hypothetical protein